MANNTASAEKATSGVENAGQKVVDKVLEKRRALGRGLESLLGGPRTVTPPQPMKGDGASAVVPRTQGGAEIGIPALASAETYSGERAGATISAHAAEAGPDVPAVVAGTTGNPVPTGAESMRSGERGDVFQIDINSVDSNPHQTRRQFNEEALQELADSISTQGLLQPIVVRPGKDGRYTLILGERRLRASQMAGVKTLPAIVRQVSEQQAAEMTVVENLQRQDLDCVEQAAAFEYLSKRFNLTQEEIGARVGVARETVANYMRLLILPDGVIGALRQGRLTFSHARLLLKLRDNAQIWKMAQKAMDENLSVAQLDALLAADLMRADHSETSGNGKRVDPNVLAAQRSLEIVLGMRVQVQDRNGRGRIVIQYGSLEDFDRVVAMLKGKS
jgi:ParB family transcriptional regulator, chromosome partitioning protein